MDEPLTPYEKGRAEAWLSSVTRNPYDHNSESEREWFIGWQDAKNERIAELEAALREARGMLSSCGFEHPEDDPELVVSWERGLAKIDAALGSVL